MEVFYCPFHQVKHTIIMLRNFPFLWFKKIIEFCIILKVMRVWFKTLSELSFLNHWVWDLVLFGMWSAPSGGFQNGLAMAKTPKKEPIRTQSLKQVFQLWHKAISKMITIWTFRPPYWPKSYCWVSVGLVKATSMKNFVLLQKD